MDSTLPNPGPTSADGDAVAGDGGASEPWSELLTQYMATGPIGLLTLDEDTTVVHANEVAAVILEQDVTGQSFFDLVHPEDAARIIAAVGAYSQGTVPRGGRGSVWRMMLPSGGSVEILASAAIGEAGQTRYGQVGFLQAPPRLAVLETLELVAAGRPLTETLAALAAGLADDHIGMAINWLDHDGNVHLFGSLDPVLAGVGEHGGRDTDRTTPWAEAIERGVATRRDGLDGFRPDIVNAARAAGYQACCVSPVVDPGSGQALLYVNWVHHSSHIDYVQQTFADVLHDVLQVALVRAEDIRKLVHAAHHDQLTGLANRRAFFDTLTTAISAGAASVLYLDLDEFKPINDRLGHDAGDRVLAVTADRLTRASPPGSLVSRLGGDEFAIVIAGDDGPAAERLAGELIEVIARPIDLADEGTVSVSISIGFAITDAASADDPRGLVSSADAALRRAKGAGKGAWVRAERRGTSSPDADG